MKESKVAIALVVGILIGLAVRGMHHGNKCVPGFRDQDVHSYLLDQLEAMPDITKVESLQMGFDGKSLHATVLTRDGKDKAIISYTLSDGGYYQAHGQWNFDVGAAMKLWPYEVD